MVHKPAAAISANDLPNDLVMQQNMGFCTKTSQLVGFCFNVRICVAATCTTADRRRNANRNLLRCTISEGASHQRARACVQCIHPNSSHTSELLQPRSSIAEVVVSALELVS